MCWFAASLGGEAGDGVLLEDAEIDASGCGVPFARAGLRGGWVETFGVGVVEGVFIPGLKKVKTGWLGVLVLGAGE